MRDFLFGLAAPGANEDAQASVRCYESVDGLSGWVLLEEIAAADLQLDPGDSGDYLWTVDAADTINYQRLVPVSAGGFELEGVIVPPKAPAATVRVVVWTTDVGLGEVEGLEFSVLPVGKKAISAHRLIVKSNTVQTDAAGYAELLLPADAGEFSLTLEHGDARVRLSGKVDTTGQSGQTFNLKDLLI